MAQQPDFKPNAGDKALQLAAYLTDIGASTDNPLGRMSENLHKDIQSAAEARAKKEYEQQLKKQQQGGILGSLGSIGGGVLGTLIPGVGPVVGGALGGMGGGAAGEAIGGGKIDPMNLVRYGTVGGIGGGLVGGWGASGPEAGYAGAITTKMTGGQLPGSSQNVAGYNSATGGMPGSTIMPNGPAVTSQRPSLSGNAQQFINNLNSFQPTGLMRSLYNTINPNQQGNVTWDQYGNAHYQ